MNQCKSNMNLDYGMNSPLNIRNPPSPILNMACPPLPRMDARRGKPSPREPSFLNQNPQFRPFLKNHAKRVQEIQEATASEPLSLEEEYAMQRSWRQDADKLTFIACRPLSDPTQRLICLSPEDDSPENMVGDINLFLRVDDGDEGSAQPEIIGEIELMIAEKVNQRKGYGKAALLTFLRYIVDRQNQILGEFVHAGCGGVDGETLEKVKTAAAAAGEGLSFSCLSVKIGQDNGRSLALFEGLGFVRVSESPSFFGEFELRRRGLGRREVDALLEGAGVGVYVEVAYERKE